MVLRQVSALDVNQPMDFSCDKGFALIFLSQEFLFLPTTWGSILIISIVLQGNILARFLLLVKTAA